MKKKKSQKHTLRMKKKKKKRNKNKQKTQVKNEKKEKDTKKRFLKDTSWKSFLSWKSLKSDVRENFIAKKLHRKVTWHIITCHNSWEAIISYDNFLFFSNLFQFLCVLTLSFLIFSFFLLYMVLLFFVIYCCDVSLPCFSNISKVKKVFSKNVSKKWCSDYFTTKSPNLS